MKNFLILLMLILSPAAFAGTPWGITAHVPAVSDYDYMDELGVSWVRIDFNWSDIEASRKGSYSWGIHDDAVNEAVSRGIKIFATIAYTPAWAREGGDINSPPARSSDWYDFVYRCVRRYSGRISHWGMWNEPNLPEFWTGTMEQYVYDILIPGARAVREADGTARVLGPELSDRNRLYTLESLAYIFSHAGDSIDIVTQHAYGQPTSIFFFLDQQVRPILDELAPGKELWITETGARSDVRGEEYQASVYRQICDGIIERNYIQKVFFYKLVDGFEPEDWGLLNRDYRPKEAFGAYRAKINDEHFIDECFIAGAVFGKGSLEIFRLYLFRDDFLIESAPGRLFVRAYYKLSPFIARACFAQAGLAFFLKLHLRSILGGLKVLGV